MKLYSYIMVRDFGFAPNPFHGFCTLATCMPQVRAKASVGDWIIGTGSKSTYDLAGHLIYAMQVSEILDFDAYWNDARFVAKRPALAGSLKVIYGDNIYHRAGKHWIQANSHHSLENGQTNMANLDRDTGVNRLLVATKFVYWGAAAPAIPMQFRNFRRTGEDICCRGRGRRVFRSALAPAFAAWLEKQNRWGVQGEPLEFASHQSAFAVLQNATSVTLKRVRRSPGSRKPGKA